MMRNNMNDFFAFSSFGSRQTRGDSEDNSYYVRSGKERIIEKEGGGNDTVYSYASYTLPEHIENLTLMGRSSIRAVGNSSDNILTGNGGSNVLLGKAGNDVLDGKEGNDWLEGGEGSDTYLFGRGYGKDTVFDYSVTKPDGTFESSNTVKFAEGIKPTDLTLTIIKGYDLSTVSDKPQMQPDRFVELGGQTWQLGIKGTNDVLTIFNQTGYETDAIGRFVFDSGEMSAFELFKSMDFEPSYLSGLGGSPMMVGEKETFAFYGTPDADLNFLTMEGRHVDIYAGDGHDNITLMSGTARFEGGKGDDLFQTYSEATAYFANGDGNDTIMAYGEGNVSLYLSDVFNKADLTIGYSEHLDINEAVIRMKDSADSITLLDKQSNEAGTFTSPVGSIVLGSGERISLSDIMIESYQPAEREHPGPYAYPTVTGGYAESGSFPIETLTAHMAG